MTELKTLKDIPMPLDYEGTLSRDDLKAEAVKWANKYYKENETWNWDFLDFFNLTEEDLEEKEK